MIRAQIRPQIRSQIRRMIGREGAWTPSDITTLGWYDPSNISTITSATNLVSQIDDIGSSGIEHLVQGTVSKQMSTGLQTINGLNALSSTIATRLMENLTFPVPVSGNLAISFVAQIDGQVSSTSSSLISMDSPANKDWQINANNATQFNGAMNASGIGSFDLMSGGPFAGPDIWTIVFDFDNLTKKIFVNGIERSSGTYTTAMDLVQKLRVFANRGGANPVFGLFGEMIITEDVTEATRSNACDYLTAKWLNLSPNLVSNGDFSNGTTDWTAEGGATLSVTSDVMRVEDTLGQGLSQAFQFVNLVAGKTYIVECEARTVIGTFAHFIIGREGGSEFDDELTASTTFTTLSMEFTPSFSSGDDGLGYRVVLRESGVATGDIAEFKNVSVREKL